MKKSLELSVDEFFMGLAYGLGPEKLFLPAFVVPCDEAHIEGHVLLMIRALHEEFSGTGLVPFLDCNDMETICCFSGAVNVFFRDDYQTCFKSSEAKMGCLKLRNGYLVLAKKIYDQNQAVFDRAVSVLKRVHSCNPILVHAFKTGEVFQGFTFDDLPPRAA